MRRKVGWPMGGSFSEAATLIDLGTDVRNVHKNARRQKLCGWYHKGIPLDKLIMGLTHVDDSILTKSTGDFSIGISVYKTGCNHGVRE